MATEITYSKSSSREKFPEEGDRSYADTAGTCIRTKLPRDKDFGIALVQVGEQLFTAAFFDKDNPPESGKPVALTIVRSGNIVKYNCW